MQTFNREKELGKAEKSNIVGKSSSDDSDIIPLDKLYPPQDSIDENDDSDTTSSEEELLPWKPIDMAYGMNVIS